MSLTIYEKKIEDLSKIDIYVMNGERVKYDKYDDILDIKFDKKYFFRERKYGSKFFDGNYKGEDKELTGLWNNNRALIFEVNNENVVIFSQEWYISEEKKK